MEEQFINDLSPIEGVYSDFIYLKEGSLVSLIRVSGVNFDLLSISQQNILFQEYETFLAQNAYYDLQIVSATMPIKISEYLRKWKIEYVKAVNNDNITENLRQLKASYLYDFQRKEASLEMNHKKHYIVIKEHLKKLDIENLRKAEKRLREKTAEITRSLSSFLGSYDCEIEIVPSYEILNILKKLMDFGNTFYCEDGAVS